MKCAHYVTAKPPTPDACARKFHSASACGPQCPDWEKWQAEETARKAGLIVALPQAQPVLPVPRSEWPFAVAKMTVFAKPEDAGVGDIVARKLGKTGEAFKAFMKSIGIDCGCQQRQEWLNQRYPLP